MAASVDVLKVEIVGLWAAIVRVVPDANAPAGGKYACVDSSGHVHLVLDVRSAAGTIAGSVSIADASACGFYGWLELIDLIDRAVEVPGGVPERSSREGGPGELG